MPAPQSMPNVFNFNPASNLQKWRRAKGRVRAGVANARIHCVGDSTTFGYGAKRIGLRCGSQTGGWMAACYPQRLTDYLNKGGITATSNSFSQAVESP